ncbi:MAG: DUF4906 domain-containing protein [Bacteroidales bacterium]
MKKILLHILIFIITCSCIKESAQNISETTSKVTTVKLKLNLSHLEEIATKSLPNVEEAHVANLWILQFNGQTDAAKLVKADYITQVDLNNISISLNTGTSQSVYFIANTFDNTLFNGTNAVINSYSLLDLKNKSLTINSENDIVVSNSGNNYLRMTGKYCGDIPSGSEMSVSLNRNCAKVEFSYTSLPSVNASELDAIVKIQSVQLKNVPKYPKYLCDPSNALVSEPSGIIDYGVINTGIGETSGNTSFYLSENIRGDVPENTSPMQKASTAPLKSTYIEVIGHYYPKDSPIPTKMVIYKIYLGKNSFSNFNVNSNCRYRVNVIFMGTNISDSRIVVDEIPVYVTESNSYMVDADGNERCILIPVSRIISGIAASSAIGGNTLSFDKMADWTAEALWLTWNPVSTGKELLVTKFSNDYLKVKIPTGINGNNAVIAVRQGGKIVWSWHIWITDYKPLPNGLPCIDAKKVTHKYGGAAFLTGGHLENKVVMDRNLGATWTGDQPILPSNIGSSVSKSVNTYGLHYEWGRKDPFPNFDGNTVTPTYIKLYDQNGNLINFPAVNTQRSLSEAINNPMEFLTAAKWCSRLSNDFWNGAGNNKTVFDPCPPGWRIPRLMQMWIGFATNFTNYDSGSATAEVSGPTAGRLYTGISGNATSAASAWYPYCGVIRLSVPGGVAAYWSAEPVVDGYYHPLRIYKGADGVILDYHGFYSGYGLPVRCVQE